MLASLLIFAQETAHEEHAEPTAFYILGGVAAVWAMLLFAVGMRAPSFPGSVMAQRAVMLVSVAVVAATMASAVLGA